MKRNFRILVSIITIIIIVAISLLIYFHTSFESIFSPLL